MMRVRLLGVMMLVTTGACGGGSEPPPPPPVVHGLTERIDNTHCVPETVNGATVTPAPTLSATGCYSDIATQTVVDGMTPFDINVPLWTDGAEKRRYFGVPPGSVITWNPNGPWDLPVGSVLMKEFYLDQVEGDSSTRFIVETRFLVRDADRWRGYGYQWNATHTEGTLLLNTTTGITDTYTLNGPAGPADHTYYFPGRTECLRCHPTSVSVPLGLQTPQMNRSYSYAAGTDNQLSALNYVGFFDHDIEAEIQNAPVLPNPNDTTLSNATRARAVMHANCSHCHQPNGSAVSAIIKDMRYGTPLADTLLCARITPGDPASSPVWTRVESVSMPPLGAFLFDPRLQAIHDWIQGMTSCP